MKSSSIFKLSYLFLSNTYELEYSFIHVIIMIYELVYSLCVMIMTCSTLSLNLSYNIYDGVEVVVHCAFRFAHVLACQSVGLGSMGDMSSFLVCEHGARVHEDL
jgi:multidrug transporter EmrE-like cation transporter